MSRRDRIFFFQAEDGIRDLVRSRGLGDVYKRQIEKYIDGGLRYVIIGTAAVKNPGFLKDACTAFGLSLIHI